MESLALTMRPAVLLTRDNDENNDNDDDDDNADYTF